MLAQLGRPGGEDDEDRAGAQVAGQLVERLDRGRVRQVDVVKDDHHRRFLCEVAEEDREALHQPWVKRLVAGQAPPDRGHTAEHAGEVVEHPPAESPDLRGRKPAQVTLEGLHPEAEGGRRAERVGAGGEGDDGALGPVDPLGGETGLADAGVGQEEDATEFAGDGTPKLGVELGEFPSPADQAQPRGRRGHGTLWLPLPRQLSGPTPPGYRVVTRSGKEPLHRVVTRVELPRHEATLAAGPATYQPRLWRRLQCRRPPDEWIWSLDGAPDRWRRLHRSHPCVWRSGRGAGRGGGVLRSR